MVTSFNSCTPVQSLISEFPKLASTLAPFTPSILVLGVQPTALNLLSESLTGKKCCQLEREHHPGLFNGSFLGVISCSGGYFEKLNDITFHGRFLYNTIFANNVYPNKIVKIPTTTQNHSKRTHRRFSNVQAGNMNVASSLPALSRSFCYRY